MEVLVPSLPSNVEFAKVVAIHSNVGDQVLPDQPLFDIETDKVVLEVTSPVAARVSALNVSLGESVEGKQLLMVLDDIRTEESTSFDSPTEAEISDESAKTGQSGMSFAYLVAVFVIGFMVTMAVLRS